LFGDAVGELQSFFGDQWNAYVKEVTEKSMDRCVKVRIGIPPWEVDQSCVAKVAMEVAVSPQFWGGVQNRGKDKLEVILGKVTGGDAGGATDIAGAAADVLGGLTGGLFENKSKRVTLPMLEQIIGEEIHRISEAEREEAEEVLLGSTDAPPQLGTKDLSQMVDPDADPSDWGELDLSQMVDTDLSDPAYDVEAETWVNLEEQLINLFTADRVTKHLSINHIMDAIGDALTSGRAGADFAEEEVAKAMEKWIYSNNLG